ncbi:putative leader peptide [Kineococcus terrestris]
MRPGALSARTPLVRRLHVDLARTSSATCRPPAA